MKSTRNLNLGYVFFAFLMVLAVQAWTEMRTIAVVDYSQFQNWLIDRVLLQIEQQEGEPF